MNAESHRLLRNPYLLVPLVLMAGFVGYAIRDRVRGPNLSVHEGDSVGTLPRTQVALAAVRANVLVAPYGAKEGLQGLASGFFVDTLGTLVTSYHALRDADSLVIENTTGVRARRVQLLAVSRPQDLVLLRVDTPVPGILLRADTEPVPGQTVYSMGNPVGALGTFAEGLLSGVRPLSDVTLLQVTAPLSLGSSGGAVLNARGQVIGVASWSVTSAQNIGYAVHVRHLAALLAQAKAPVPFSRQQLAAWAGPDSGPTALEQAVNGPWDMRRQTEAARDTGTNAAGDASPGATNGSPRDAGDVITRQLREVDSLSTGTGFVTQGAIRYDTLAQGRATRFALPLEAGAYIMVAACDVACDKVLVQLTGASARHVLLGDPGTDSRGMLGFKLPKAETVRGEVRMEKCRAERCVYGLRVARMP